MAHYVVLKSYDSDGLRNVTGLVYVPVPGGNNSAGIPWTTVAVGWTTWSNRRSGGGTHATVPMPSIQPDLDAGNVVEWRWQTSFPDTHTNPQALAAIETAVAAAVTAFTSEIGSALRYWGFEDDTP